MEKKEKLSNPNEAHTQRTRVPNLEIDLLIVNGEIGASL